MILKPFVTFRDDGQVRISVFKKGRGEQEILTDKKIALSIARQILLKEKEPN